MIAPIAHHDAARGAQPLQDAGGEQQLQRGRGPGEDRGPET